VIIDYIGPARPPQRAYPGDAGFDLPAAQPYRINVGAYQDIAVDLRVALPLGYFALILGRSSTLRTRGLLVDTAVIDNGYRGPMFVGVRNIGDCVQYVAKGDRLGQLVILPLAGAGSGGVEWRRQTVLPISERGEQGFGSSGR
jgi:dUTP pyrophosphatase